MIFLGCTKRAARYLRLLASTLYHIQPPESIGGDVGARHEGTHAPLQALRDGIPKKPKEASETDLKPDA
jgi:hypothetical protein